MCVRGSIDHGVHPRVGGGAGGERDPRMAAGSIPAWAGEPPRSAPPGSCDGGSIPAWAGEPQSSAGSRDQLITVHPRVGGGATVQSRSGRPVASRVHPRVGGGAVGPPSPAELLGSIPAWAGEPSRMAAPSSKGGSIPAWAGEPLTIF